MNNSKIWNFKVMLGWPLTIGGGFELGEAARGNSLAQWIAAIFMIIAGFYYMVIHDEV